MIQDTHGTKMNVRKRVENAEKQNVQKEQYPVDKEVNSNHIFWRIVCHIFFVFMRFILYV